MKTISTGLVVVGDFSQIGSITTHNVALWNGSQWLSMNLPHNDNFVNCVESYNNQIYVGTFSFSHSHVYRFTGTVGVNEINSNTNISIYPCVTKGNVTIELPEEKGATILSVCNITGQELMIKKITGTHEQVDISSLSKGVYFLSLQLNSDRVVKKIVKE